MLRVFNTQLQPWSCLQLLLIDLVYCCVCVRARFLVHVDAGVFARTYTHFAMCLQIGYFIEKRYLFAVNLRNKTETLCLKSTQLWKLAFIDFQENILFSNVFATCSLLLNRSTWISTWVSFLRQTLFPEAKSWSGLVATLKHLTIVSYKLSPALWVEKYVEQLDELYGLCYLNIATILILCVYL